MRGKDGEGEAPPRGCGEVTERPPREVGVVVSARGGCEVCEVCGCEAGEEGEGRGVWEGGREGRAEGVLVIIAFSLTAG